MGWIVNLIVGLFKAVLDFFGSKPQEKTPTVYKDIPADENKPKPDDALDDGTPFRRSDF